MDFSQRDDIPRWTFFTDAFTCCNKGSKQVKRHRILVGKGLKRLDEELDILNILRQLRLLSTAYRATQTGATKKFLENFSEKILSSAPSAAESSDSD